MPGLTNQIALLRNALADILPEEAINAMFGLFANCGLNLNHRGRFNIEFNSDTVKSPDEALAALTVSSNGVLIDGQFHGAPAVNINGPVIHNGVAAAPPRSRYMYKAANFVIGANLGDAAAVVVPLTELDELLHKPKWVEPVAGAEAAPGDWDDSADGNGAKLPEDGIYCYHILAHGAWDGDDPRVPGNGPVDLATALYVNGMEYARTHATLGAGEMALGSGNVKQYEEATCNLCHSGIFAGLRGHEVKMYTWVMAEEQDGAGEEAVLKSGKTKLGLSLHQISSGLDERLVEIAVAANARPFPPA